MKNWFLFLHRSMCFNHRRTEIAVISSNGYIHCWDANRFKQIMSKKLPHSTENVCLAVDEDCSMYAVGSKANTDLLDSRTVTVRFFSSIFLFSFFDFFLSNYRRSKRFLQEIMGTTFVQYLSKATFWPSVMVKVSSYFGTYVRVNS